jgi:hypothetical protein
MKTWLCYGKVVGSKYLGTVKAKTEKEALEKASELEECYISLCNHCISECEDAEITQIIVEVQK